MISTTQSNTGNLRFQGVIFDLDGVLCSTDNYHFEAWARVCKEEGLPFNSEVNHLLRGVSRMDSVNRILDNANVTFSEEKKEAFAMRKNQYYVEYLQSLTANDLNPATKQVLDTLAAKGIKTAIGSSSKNARLILQKLGITEQFDAIIDGTMITHSKPDPQVFTKAAQALGLSAAQCLVVEDAQAGIEAAIGGGFLCAGIGQAEHCKDTSFPMQSLIQLLLIV